MRRLDYRLVVQNSDGKAYADTYAVTFQEGHERQADAEALDALGNALKRMAKNVKLESEIASMPASLSNG